MKYVVLALCIALCGCNFHVDGDHGSDGGDGDMSLPIDTDLGGADLAMGNDLVGLPIVCTAGASSCSGSTLVTCPDGTAEMMTACPLGCSTTGGAHCNVIHPRAPVTTGDFDTTGLVPVTLSAAIYMSADNGQIGPTGTPLRQANNDVNSYEVHQGIGFRVAAIPGSTVKMGIYTFKSLAVSGGVVVNVYGGNAIALVSAGDVTVDGEIDVSCAGNYNLSVLLGAAHPYVAGPGGGAGGQPNVPSVGFGTGGVGGVNADNTHAAGGGGGAYGDVGGMGGAMGGNAGGASGPTYGDAMLTTLVGGAGGGAGGQAANVNFSVGGGGGGLVLLVSMGTVTLGSGGAAGGVNAGGCGGTTEPGVGGGAGGSGGTIFVQAVAVHVAANGVLAANGGSGAAGNATAGAATNGQPGAFSSAAASGGQTGGGADGGNGGALASTNGNNGGGAAGSGGGAGGSVGRIRVESQSGSATVAAGGAISPIPAQGTVDIH